VNWLHHRIGISVDDPRTTWINERFHIQAFSYHEDMAGNALYVLLFGVSGVLFVFQRPLQWKPAAYLFALAGAGLLFCAYLKWQPWHSRLHLPWFVLASPWTGVVLARVRAKWIANAGMLLILAAALPWLFLNSSRPLLRPENIFNTPRGEQYFANDPSLAAPYRQAVQILAERGCGQVGLVSGEDGWEYPLWVFLREQMGASIHVQHVNVTNISQSRPETGRLAAADLCALVKFSADDAGTVMVEGLPFTREWASGSLSLYFP
jgi:hypothetical protein